MQNKNQYEITILLEQLHIVISLNRSQYANEISSKGIEDTSSLISELGQDWRKEPQLFWKSRFQFVLSGVGLHHLGSLYDLCRLSLYCLEL